MQAISVFQKNILFFSTSLLLSASPILAEVSSKPAAKSKLTAEIFEKEESSENFTAQIKLIRDMAGEAQVFFQNHPGVYSLENSSSGARIKNLLIKAQKKNTPLKITAEKDSRLIKEAAEPE